MSFPQVFFTPAQSSTEKPLLPDTSTANNTDYETAISLSEPETAVPCLPLQEQMSFSGPGSAVRNETWDSRMIPV